ncbi:MAG: hypothetical protein ACAH83_16085 [Alphaproteobacteria bacterium]
MKRKTSSDDIKELFKTASLGDAGDWKRVEKKKNEEGLTVRTFKNNKSASVVDVTEHPDGRFHFKGKNVEAWLRASKNAEERTPSETTITQHDTDPERNRAADAVIARMLPGGSGYDFIPSDDPLVASAGKALANRFTFAIKKSEEDEEDGWGFYAIITPTAYWKKTGYCFDQESPLDKLLPEGEDVNGCGTWVIADKAAGSAAGLAKMLIARGFAWDLKFQDFIEPSLTKTVLSALQRQNAPKAPSA